jgi:NAD(P)-dependent dehydrogenase (short-subunit alcohol dehydrogenase family)
MVTVADKTVLVTGANRGIGRALVEEALGRGRSGCTPAPARPGPTRTGGSQAAGSGCDRRGPSSLA